MSNTSNFCPPYANATLCLNNEQGLTINNKNPKINQYLKPFFRMCLIADVGLRCSIYRGEDLFIMLIFDNKGDQIGTKVPGRSRELGR